MTKRDFAALACKILGIYFFVKSIAAAPTVFSTSIFSLWQSHPGISLGMMLMMTFASLVSFAIPLVISILLWFKSAWLADRIFAKDSSPTILTADKNLLQMALTLTGVVILALIIPHLFGVITTHIALPESVTQVPAREALQNQIDFWATLAQTFIGIWLVFGAGKIAAIIKFAHSATKDAEA